MFEATCKSIVTGDDGAWLLDRVRRLRGATIPDCVSLTAQGSAVYISSESRYKMIYDSMIPMEEETEKEDIEKSKTFLFCI